jgi:hypothetical protein
MNYNEVMKVSYLFPVFKDDNAQSFFEKFFASKFFSSHDDCEILAYVSSSDKNNVETLKNFAQKNKNFFLNIIEEPLDYNFVFREAVTKVKGDILLLGDCKVNNIDILFSKCVEKHKSGANIVFVKQKKRGIKKFFANMFQSIYNFFIRLFTGKKDRFNIISLGLYDKNVVDLFATLPNKCCFLKNTKDMFEFSSKTIYIDESVKTFRPNFAQKSNALIASIISISLFVVLLATTIVLNATLSSVAFEFNIISIFLLIIFLVSFAMLFPKHFFDIRNEVLRITKK